MGITRDRTRRIFVFLITERIFQIFVRLINAVLPLIFFFGFLFDTLHLFWSRHLGRKSQWLSRSLLKHRTYFFFKLLTLFSFYTKLFNHFKSSTFVNDPYIIFEMFLSTTIIPPFIRPVLFSLCIVQISNRTGSLLGAFLQLIFFPEKICVFCINKL